MAMMKNKPVESDAPSPARASEGSSPVDSDVKVPESFQKAAYALLGQCSSPQCLDYLMSCCSDKRQEMMDSDNDGDAIKDFDDDGM